MIQRIVLGAADHPLPHREPEGLVGRSIERLGRRHRPVLAKRDRLSRSTRRPSHELSSQTSRNGRGRRRRRSALAAAQADGQYFPLQSYRVGPYAAGGTGFFGGFIDYMNLINTRDGGVNGVKLTWSEGETQYDVEKGVEVYERLKSNPGIAAWNPLSVGIAYAMIDRITDDKVPLITVNHGRTDTTDGRVFPYVFPLLLNPYSETSGIVNYIASQGGRAGKPQGQEDRRALSRLALRQGDDPDLRAAGREVRLRTAADRSSASRQRAAGAVADHPPRPGPTMSCCAAGA